jgi:hypothetical protein
VGVPASGGRRVRAQVGPNWITKFRTRDGPVGVP